MIMRYKVDSKVCDTRKRITRYEETCCLEENLGKTFIETRPDNGGISYLLCPNRKPRGCPRSCLDIYKVKPGASSGYYKITNEGGEEREVYCEMEGDKCNEGGWTRVAYVNMSDPGTTCPIGLTQQLYTDSNYTTHQLCVNNHTNTDTDFNCDQTTFDTHGISYSKVCGRVYGYQHGRALAFNKQYQYPSLMEPYVSGVSITRNNKHVWTFASSDNEILDPFLWGNYCPCSDELALSTSPQFVGEHYYCESGRSDDPYGIGFKPDLFLNDRLWDGKHCNIDEEGCCPEHTNLPWFVRTLPHNEQGNIDLRVCGKTQNEYSLTPVELIELYIK